MRQFLAGAVAAPLTAAWLALIVIGVGGAPVGADRAPSALETRLLGMALRASVARNVAGESATPPASSDDLAAGAEIYREMCARCHGDATHDGSTLGASFYPPAPRLVGRASVYDERELSWIIKHGVRNTGMPAWGALLSDDDIRQVAAVVKRFGSSGE